MPEKRKIDAMDVEHIGSLVTGGLLFVKGLTTRGPLGALYKIGGLALAYRGQQGYGKLYDKVGLSLAKNPTGVGRQNVRVDAAVDIDRSPMDLYRIWRNFENLPIFMSHLQKVEEHDDKCSKWTTKAPFGMVVSWEAEIINDVPGEIIAWQTLEGSGVDTAGSVRFEPHGEGTRLKVVLRYDPPADLGGYALAKIVGLDAQRQVSRDLEDFKRAIEAKSIDGKYALTI